MKNRTEVLKKLSFFVDDLPERGEYAHKNKNSRSEYATYIFKNVFPVVTQVLRNQDEVLRNQAVFALTKIDYSAVANDFVLFNRAFSIAEAGSGDKNHLVRENAMVVLTEMTKGISTDKIGADELLIKIFELVANGLKDTDSFVIGKSARALDCVGERIIKASVILDNSDLKEIVDSMIESLEDGRLGDLEYPLLVRYGDRALFELMLAESKREGISLLEIYKRYFGKQNN